MTTKEKQKKDTPLQDATIYEKLLHAQQTIEPLIKNARNPHFKNDYADLTETLRVAKNALNAVGILVTQPTEFLPEQNVNVVKTTLIDTKTGQKIEASLQLTSNANPQAMGSQITYFKRYTLKALLGIADEDDDAQLASQSVTANNCIRQNLTDEILVKMRKARDFENKIYTLEEIGQKYNITPEWKEKLISKNLVKI